MSATKSKAKNKASAKKERQLTLGTTLGIEAAAELHEEFLQYASSDAPLSIDASKVGAVDTSVLQLLCALVQAMRELGVHCRWSGVSEYFQATAEFLGFADTLCLVPVESEASQPGAVASASK